MGHSWLIHGLFCSSDILCFFLLLEENICCGYSFKVPLIREEYFLTITRKHVLFVLINVYV